MENKYISKKRIFSVLLIMCISQIILLTLFPIATSYGINQTLDKSLGEDIKNEKKDSSLIKSGIGILVSFFSIKQIGIVSAQTNPDTGCCAKMKNPPSGPGGWCEPVEEDDCEPGFWSQGSNCEKIADCEKKYCYDKTEGTCTPSTKIACEENGGVSVNKEDNICKPGCCIIGNNMYWVSEQMCGIKASNEGYSKKEAWDPFTDIETSLECLTKTNEQPKGACVEIESGSCKYTSEIDCQGNFEVFEEGKFCTDSSLADEYGVDCKKTDNLECQREDVVYIDSCGNFAGIKESCDGTTTRCQGNKCEYVTCDYEGTTYKHGEQWCIYDSAIGESNGTSSVGVSADAPGSTHFIASCVNGEVEINPCNPSGNRKFVCSESEQNFGDESWKSASCEMNFGMMCNLETFNFNDNVSQKLEDNLDLKKIDYSSCDTDDLEGQIETKTKALDDSQDEDEIKSLEEDIGNLKEQLQDACKDEIEKYNKKYKNNLAKIREIRSEEAGKLEDRCGENPHCRFLESTVGKTTGDPKHTEDYGGLNTIACVPRFPSGRDFSSEEDDTMCALATSTKTIMFRKNLGGRWVCDQGCEFLTDKYIEEMNDYCVSLGDCGSYPNYAGEFSNNIDVKVKITKSESRTRKQDEGGYIFTDARPAAKRPGGAEKYLVDGGKKSHMAIINSPDRRDRKKAIEKALEEAYKDLKGEEKVQSLIKNPENIGPGHPFYSYLGGERGNWADWVAGIGGGLGAGVAGWLAFQYLTQINLGLFVGNTAKVSSFANWAMPISGAILGAAVGHQVSKATGAQGPWTWLLPAIGAAVGLTAGIIVVATAGTANAWNPVGWITLGLLALFEGYMLISGAGKTAQAEIKFECKPWTPPIGKRTIKECAVCQDNPKAPGAPCTEYKCKALGACQLINENTDNKKCVPIDDPGKPPELTLVDNKGYNFATSEGHTLSTTETISETFEEETRFNFTLGNLNKSRMQCRYSLDPNSEGASYEDMESYTQLTSQENGDINIKVNIPSVASLNSSYYYSSNGTKQFKFNSDYVKLYLKCTDQIGNVHEGEKYTLRFKVKRIPDKTPPVPIRFEPESPKSYKYIPQDKHISLFVKETRSPNVKCKISNSATSYDQMSNETVCQSYPLEEDSYKCNFNLENLQVGQNTFYILCKDGADPNNIQSTAMEYKLNIENYVSQEDFCSDPGKTLQIDINSPLSEETVQTNKMPATVNLEVQTSHGADEGKASCEYSLNGFDNMAPFDVTNGVTTHTKELNYMLNNGNYTAYVRCEDEACSANATVDFALNIDQDAPTMIGNTQEGDDLTITLDEPAKCSYTPSSCNFDLLEGVSFDFLDFATEQKTPWNPSENYFIRCVDAYGNEGCAGQIGSGSSNGPVITRIFYDAGDLSIKTDRSSQCYYDFNSCSFDIDKADEEDRVMSSDFTKIHTTTWNPSTKYHIRCKDKWGLLNPGCAAVIQPESFSSKE